MFVRCIITCIFLTANRKEFVIYFYHSPSDVLLKTGIIPYKDEESINRCFLLSMVMEHTSTINQQMFTKLKGD